MVRSYVLEVRLVNWRTCHFTRRSFRVELAARKYYCTAHVVETRLHSVYILFAAPRCASAVYYAMALCPSVSVSVCLSQVGVLLKWLNIGSRRQNHTIAEGF